MTHLRAPWLLIGSVLKFFGWKSYELTNAVIGRISNVTDPETIEYLSNLFGAMADMLAVVAFIIAIYHFIEKKLKKRNAKN